MFSNGDGEDTVTPFYRGMDTDEEMKIVDAEIFCCGDVAGIQVEQYRDHLTGLRLFNDNGDIILDYELNDGKLGEWAQPLKVPEGQEIIGLMVNQQEVDIHRIAFLLWDREPGDNTE